MGEFQPLHWLLVIAAVMILFGPKRLPEIGRSLGQSFGEFKRAMRNGFETPEAEKEKETKIS
jgi:sec-independent protein translocase protein TatA